MHSRRTANEAEGAERQRLLRSRIGLLLMNLRPALTSEHQEIQALLSDNKLPVDDLATAAVEFIVAIEGEHVLGVAGLERFGGAGLLRSLAVARDQRGSGLGGALVQAVESLAREQGLRQLVLLTLTAAPFFARRGYVLMARESVPAAVRNSAEFRSICPASAICMAKALDSHDLRKRVLFLCTGNSARSVLAEATLRSWGGQRFEVFSAGSQPAGTISPYALEQLAAENIATAGLHSKSWNEFVADGTTPMDLVVTVCDSAAAETCPIAFGDFVRTHWGLPDPAAVHGSEEDKREAFRQAHRTIKARMRALLALPGGTWDDRIALKQALDRIGYLQPDDEVTAHG
jgi:protein-tyrosine-phosphatase/N-acetylglutamate synthase-like GNAT family acetyltransferase